MIEVLVPIDISPLQRLPLEDLLIGRSHIKDLTPLKKMKLKRFSVWLNPDFSEISLLSGMPLEDVNLQKANVSSLEALRGKSLRMLNITETKVADLSPLIGMTSLRTLYASSCQLLRDLSPLAGLPLESLSLHEIRAELDLAPLLDCPDLKDLTLPLAHRNLEKLRQHPSLQRLCERATLSTNPSATQTVAEFWKEYDAKQAAAKK